MKRTRPGRLFSGRGAGRARREEAGDGLLVDVVIYHQSAYTQMPLVVFARELLELQGLARDKALRKLRELEQSMLCPLENLRPP